MASSAASTKGGLDAVLHQPVRTQIVAYLVGRGEATFTELKQVLTVSDGNLESHLKKLVAARYVATRKDDSAMRTQTVYSLTRTGEAALRQYVFTLQRMLGFDATGASGASPKASLKGKLAWTP